MLCVSLVQRESVGIGIGGRLLNVVEAQGRAREGIFSARRTVSIVVFVTSPSRSVRHGSFALLLVGQTAWPRKIISCAKNPFDTHIKHRWRTMLKTRAVRCIACCRIDVVCESRARPTLCAVAYRGGGRASLGEKGGTGGARERPQNDRRDAKGSTLDGGTAKATAADLQREKTPRNGRQGRDDWAVFPANCSGPKCRVCQPPQRFA